jgi:DNA repair photolyase
MDTIPAKTIVTRNKAPNSWFGCDFNMNIYKGCCHGCIYCDSRSKCYRVENFNTVRVKKDALAIIGRELKQKMRTGVIGTGAMSDPYNPFERELALTRHALELIDAHGFGVAVATKSDLITRDIDVLSDISQHSPVIVKLTITTFDDSLCKALEPHAPVSSQRLTALGRLTAAKLFAGLLLMPLLPFINDTAENVENIVRAAHKNGARFIYPAFGVTLRANQRDYFYEKLDRLFPGMKQRYIRTFGDRYTCTSPNAKKLWATFAPLCEQYGILYKMQDIITAYKADYNRQMTLF